MSIETPLLQLNVKVNAKPAILAVFNDRFEVAGLTTGQVSGGKIALGVMTGGVSLLATGVGKGSYGRGVSGGDVRDVTVVSLREVNKITRKRASKKKDLLTVLTAGDAWNFEVTADQAQQLQAVLQNSMNSLHAAAHSAPAVVAVAPGTPREKTAIEKIHELTELYQSGILTADEYAQAKSNALGL